MSNEQVLLGLLGLVISVALFMAGRLTARNTDSGALHQEEAEAIIRTTAEAVGRAIAQAMQGTAGSLDPAYWERIFDEIKRLITENIRGQGATHAKIDELVKEVRHVSGSTT